MSVAASPDRAPKIVRVYADAWAIFRRHPAALLVPGVVLFVAFGVPTVLLGPFVVGQSPGRFAAAAVAEVLGFISALLYYGYCEELADLDRRGATVSMRTALLGTARVLPSLALASVLVGVAFGVGLVLFIVPGLLLMFRLSLTTPVVSLERAGAIAAMRRSFALTRGHGRLLGPTAVAMICVEWLVPDLLEQLAESVLGDHLAAAVAADAAVNLVIAPMAGLVISVAYLRLRGR